MPAPVVCHSQTVWLPIQVLFTARPCYPRVANKLLGGQQLPYKRMDRPRKLLSCPSSFESNRCCLAIARAEPAGSTDIAEVLTENLVDKILLNAIVHQARLDADLNLVTKPFTFDQLAIKVRDVLDR